MAGPYKMLLPLLIILSAWLPLQAVASIAKPVMWILSQHPLKTARIDPLVSPGRPSSHVHSFVGSDGLQIDTVTVNQLESGSTCTTSGLDDDLSSYWAPQLYSFNAADNTFTPNRLSFVNTYYLMRGGNIQIKAFPKGFKMIAGKATQSAPGPTQQSRDIVSFVCLDYVNGSSQTPTFPQKACPQGLRTQVIFPSCWNGVDLYQTDQSHVVYPLGPHPDNGDCPSTHPIRLPTLFYEFIWAVDGQNNANYSQWVLANGDAVGYSFHADFFAAWNETTLQSAIDQCEGNLFGDLQACPPFRSSLNRKGADACSAVSTEPTSGKLKALPGCNIVFNGPNAGKGLAEGCDPSKLAVTPAGWAPSAPTTTSTSKSSSSTTSTTSRPTTTSKAAAETKPTSSSSSKKKATTTTSMRKTSTKKLRRPTMPAFAFGTKSKSNAKANVQTSSSSSKKGSKRSSSNRASR